MVDDALCTCVRSTVLFCCQVCHVDIGKIKQLLRRRKRKGHLKILFHFNCATFRDFLNSFILKKNGVLLGNQICRYEVRVKAERE